MNEENFDKALELAKRWPADKSIPAKLQQLYVESEEDPAVGMFFESLYAAAEGPGDLDLIAAVNSGE